MFNRIIRFSLEHRLLILSLAAFLLIYGSYVVLTQLADQGFRQVTLAIGHLGHLIRSFVGDGSRWGVNVAFIRQTAPAGLAHAVKESLDFIGDDRFVMFLGDNVIQGGISPLIAQFAQSQWNSQIVLTAVDDPRQFGVAELDGGGAIKRLVEKPKEPPSNLALVGIYMFDHHIREAVHAIQPSFRGELEITDAIQWLIDQGHAVHPYVHTGWWIDTGKMADMLTANAHVLEEVTPRIEGMVNETSKIDPRVTVEKGAVIEHSVIRGPTIIGEGTLIRDSYIGPFTSIYHHCLVEKSEIEHSIVLENCNIHDVPYRIADSIIGRNAVVTRSEIKPKAIKMNLGDYSQVGIL